VLICAEGFHRSDRRGRGALLLAAAFEAMNFVNMLLNRIIDTSLYLNLFGVLVLMAVYALLIAMVRAGKREGKPWVIAAAAALMLVTTALAAAAASFAGQDTFALDSIARFIPNFGKPDYALPFLVLGIVYFLLRPQPWAETLARRFGAEQPVSPKVDFYLIFVFYPAQVYLNYIIALLIYR